MSYRITSKKQYIEYCQTNKISGYSSLKEEELKYIVELHRKIMRKHVEHLPSWYKLPEISFNKFIFCLKELYDIYNDDAAQLLNPIDKSALKYIHGYSDEEIQNALKISHLMRLSAMKRGILHQRIMGMFPGYKDLGTGHQSKCDIADESETMVAEIKSAGNTMNSSSKASVTNNLKKAIKQGLNAYCVIIQWDKTEEVDKHGITWICGKRFYKKLSGRSSFLNDLYYTIGECFMRYNTFDELLTSLEIA